MKKKIIIIVALVLVSFGIGIGLSSLGLFGKKLSAEAKIGQKTVAELFGKAKYDGVAAGEGENAILRYTTGDWVVQTNSTGEIILSVALSPEAAKRAEENQGATLSEEKLKELAAEEFGKYIDVKYYVEAEATDQGGIYNISLREMKDGRETGAKGNFSYFPDGTLFCFSYNERVTDFPENEEVLDVLVAYNLAYEYVKEARPDLDVHYDPKNMVYRLGTTVKGQKYAFEFFGWSEEQKFDIYCEPVIYAVTGELDQIAYSDSGYGITE